MRLATLVAALRRQNSAQDRALRRARRQPREPPHREDRLRELSAPLHCQYVLRLADCGARYFGAELGGRRRPQRSPLEGAERQVRQREEYIRAPPNSIFYF